MDLFSLICCVVIGYIIGTLVGAILLAPVFLTIEIIDRIRIRRNR